MRNQFFMHLERFNFDTKETAFLQRQLWDHYPEAERRVYEEARLMLADLSMNKDIRVSYHAGVAVSAVGEERIIEGAEKFSVHVGDGPEFMVVSFDSMTSAPLMLNYDPEKSSPFQSRIVGMVEKEVLSPFWQFSSLYPHNQYLNGNSNEASVSIDAQFIFYRLRNFLQALRGSTAGVCDIMDFHVAINLAQNAKSHHYLNIMLAAPEIKRS